MIYHILAVDTDRLVDLTSNNDNVFNIQQQQRLLFTDLLASVNSLPQCIQTNMKPSRA